MPFLLRYSPSSFLSTLYLPPCIVPLPAAVPVSESCANHVTKLAIILVASCLPSYLSYLTRHYTCRVLLALILTVSYSLSSSLLVPSLTSYSSLYIVQLPSVSVTLRDALTMSKLAIILATSYLLSSLPPASSSLSSSQSLCSSRHAHCVVLIALCSLHCAHRVLLIVSYSSYRTQRVVLYLPMFLCFRAKCGSSIYRCTLNIKNRTGLSHYA